MIPEQSPIKGSLYSFSMGLIGKGLGFLSSLVIASLLGATIETDLIYFVYALITLAVSFLSSLTHHILLPQFIHLRERLQVEKAWDLVNTSLSLSLLLLILSSICFGLFHERFLGVFSRFEAENIHALRLGILLLTPLICLIYLNDTMTHILQAFKNFTFHYLTSVTLGGTTLISVLLLSPSLGAISIPIGFLGGTLIQFMILSGYLIFHGWKPKICLKHPENLRELLYLAGPTLLFQASSILLVYLPDYLASGMQAGTLTAILNGRKVYELLPTLLIYPLVGVAYPRLCERAARKNSQDLIYLVLSLHNFILSLILPLFALLILLAPELVGLLFFRGNYSPTAVEISTVSLRWFTVGALALVINSIGGRALMAKQEPKIALVYGLSQLSCALVSGVLIFTLVQKNGWVGISQGMAAFHLLYQLPLNLWLLHHFVGKLNLLTLGGIFFRLCCLSWTPILLSFFWVKTLSLDPVPTLIISIALGLAGFVLAHVVTRSPEAKFLKDRILTH
jgi:putative peptidoglycan lipid II flippase